MRPISVVISSLRPDRLEETIDSTAMHSDLVEVVVVSPTPPKPRDFVKHVPVPKPGETGELTFAQKFNLGTRHASGEYIVYTNDDFHFRSGWATALLKHMEQEKERPYLAAFQMAVKEVIHTRYTAFGMLYANIGCIRKEDLKIIGGLFDERYFMYTTDIDVSLRVWSKGGKVALCNDVVIDSDRDVDQVVISERSVFSKGDKMEASVGKKTYRDFWFSHDHAVFFKIWFPRYFRLFLKNYKRIRPLLTHADGVVPPKKQDAGLLKIMMWPVFNMYLNPRIFFARKNKIDFIRNHWVRVVNRRWSRHDYQLPYAISEVTKGI
ncbi:MAG: hypothetical protein Q7T03_04765 [Deltaproteobacteria bacterium]|nr:hypothetical protein [Deltaproteobacteria bacterium]